MPTPVDVALSRKKGELRIEWEDGSVSTLPIHYIRAWCPCAGCQGHGTVVRYQEADPELGIELMAEAGAYALHLRFSDGHDSGIYTWEWLQRIAPESAPTGYKHGSFQKGQFQA